MPFISLEDGSATRALPDYLLYHWKNLVFNTDQADPVCCAPVWNLTYHSVFHAQRPIYYLACHDSLLLFSESRSESGEIYFTPIEDSWMFGQPLLGRHGPELLHRALEFYERFYEPVCPFVVLSGVQEKRMEAMRLYYFFSRDFSFYKYKSVTQGIASLSGGLDGWLSRRSSNHRQKLKKAQRLARDAGITFERQNPCSDLAAALIYDRMLDIERRSWKGIGHCGMAESPAKEFYQALLVALARNRAAYVIFARLDGKDIGFIFGGAFESAYRGQQFSYDQQYAGFSPGNLLQFEKIRWLCELGFTRYDMGPVTGPRMDYKMRWVEQTREIQTWVMRKK